MYCISLSFWPDRLPDQTKKSEKQEKEKKRKKKTYFLYIGNSYLFKELLPFFFWIFHKNTNFTFIIP